MNRMILFAILFLFAVRISISNWHALESLTLVDQNGVCFSGSNSVFVICDEGYILRSKDFGNSWEQIQLFGQNNLKSIFVIDNILFVAGENGALYKSNDSGEHWIDISIEPYYHINDVIFPDQENGIIVGTKEVRIDGKIYYLASILITNDAGSSWNGMEFNEGEFNSVAYFESGNIMAVGEDGLTFKSIDYGASWCPFSLPTSENLNSISVCPDYGAFISGENGTLFHSGDGGATWERIILPEYFHLKNACYRDYGDIAVAGNKTVKIDGKTYEVATIINLNAENLQWTEEFAEQRGKYNCVSFCNPRFALAVGDSGLIAQYDLAADAESDYSPKIGYSLSQNYPNPFNPTTRIKFAVPVNKRESPSKLKEVSLKVFDLLGREIALLLNEPKSPGIYEVEFDASGLTSGIYFYRLTVGENHKSMKMVLLK